MSAYDLRVEDVAVLVEVAERGGFSAAGRALGRSTKQVSRQVARVEDAVGRRLLHRTTHAVSVTPAGRDFLVRARQLVRAAHGIAEQFDHSGSWDQRHLRVVVPTLDFGVSRWAPSLLSDFPRARLHVAVSDAPVDLVTLGHDLQLVISRPPQTTFVVRKLWTLNAVLAAHRDYLAAHGSPSSADELVHHRCLAWGADARQETWRLRRRGTLEEVAIGQGFASTSSGLLLATLEAGAGIGVCGAGYLREHGGDRGLVRVLEDHVFEPSALYAVFPGPGPRAPIVEAFIERATTAVGAWY